jgi:hypothetical protein
VQVKVDDPSVSPSNNLRATTAKEFPAKVDFVEQLWGFI